MSIWSTRLTIEPLHSIAYGVGDRDVDSQPIKDSYLDLATADSWYGAQGLRLVLNDGDANAAAVLIRSQVIDLHQALATWLAES